MQATIDIGRRGALPLEPGHYVYVGSAFGPGGLAARIRRHLRTEKSLRWHIDYLRARTVFKGAWFSTDTRRLEHRWAGILAGMRGMRPVPRFGASDCGCATHLFHARRPPPLAVFRRRAGPGVVAWRADEAWFHGPHERSNIAQITDGVCEGMPTASFARSVDGKE